MPRKLCLALVLVLAALLLTTSRASADIIDFDPERDPVPNILSASELAHYQSLIGAGSAQVSSTAGPDGRYVLVRVGGTYQVLDVNSKQLALLELGSLQISSEVVWEDSATGVVLTSNRDTGDWARTAIDFSTRMYRSVPFAIQELPGKQVRIYEGHLLKTADGRLHAPAYTVSTGRQPLFFERPTYDPRSDEELKAQGFDQPDAMVMQTDEHIVAVSLDDGSVTTIGPIERGSNLGMSFYSLRSRPGSDDVSYVVAPYLPWNGEVIRGRSARGGGMPTSYWSVQESLGRVPIDENPNLTRRSLRIVNMGSGETTVIQNSDLGDETAPPAMFYGVEWTADGSLLLVTSLTPQILEGRLHPTYEPAGGSVLQAFSPAGEHLRDLTWSDPPTDSQSTRVQPLDGTRVLLVVPVNLFRHLYTVDLADLDSQPALQPIYTGTRFLASYAVAGSRLVAAMTDVSSPIELYVADLADVDGSAERLTNVNERQRAASRIKHETIEYTTDSGFDVAGLYVYPSDWDFPPREPQPVVVWQLGGPGGQMVNSWATSVESPHSLLPNFDLPLFLVNGAGRNSNGAAYYSAMYDGTNFGQRDIEDVMDGVEHLIELGVVDGDAVGVTGCSYGGYFTLQAMSAHPEFFGAGNTQCSLNDLVYEYNFGWSPTIAALIGMPVTADPQEYVLDSPFYNSSKIQRPLLIFHGTNDFLPYEHMTSVHDQVRQNGQPARFFRAHGYGHGLGSISADQQGRKAQRYAFQLQLEWFRTHLGQSGPVTPLRAGPEPIDLLPFPPGKGVMYR